MIDENTIHRKALGRGASFGDLYDARKDDFCGISLFNKKLEDNLIELTDVPYTKLEFDFTDSYEAKFYKLDVDAELKVSVMAGLFKLEGSAKYLQSEKNNYKSVQANLIYDVRTKHESINIADEKFKDIISHASLGLDATHVVVGVKWGANVVASFEYANNEYEDKINIQGALKANLTKAVTKISGSADVKFSDEETKMNKKLSIKFHGDVIAQNEELPQTYEEAIGLVKKVPTYIKLFNNGKGKPLEYVLYPLKNVEKFFKLESKVNRVLENLNAETISRLEEVFEKLLVAKQKLNDLRDRFDKYKDHIDDEYSRELTAKINEIKNQESKFRESVSKKLVAVRSGKESIESIEGLIKNFYEGACSSESIIQFLDKFKPQEKKIKTINEFKNVKRNKDSNDHNSILFLGKDDLVDSLLMKYYNKDIYLLYFNDELFNDKIFSESRKLFTKLFREDEKGSMFFIVDYDIHPKVDKCMGVKIHFYSNETLIDEDFYGNRKKRLESNIVKSSKLKPEEAQVIKLPCPGSRTNNKCPFGEHQWICDKCGLVIEYGYDYHFYCKCGGISMDSLTFKCNSLNHQNNEFLPLDDDFKILFQKENTLSLSCVKILEEHIASVRCLLEIKDGSILSGSDDNSIKVWDLKTGICLQTLEGHTGSVRCLLESKDDSILSGSDDSSIKVWDLKTGVCLKTLEEHTDWVICLLESKDDSIFSGCHDSSIKVWDLKTGVCLKTLEGHINMVICLLKSKDGSILSGSADDSIKVWDLKTGVCLKTLEGHTDWVICLLESKDGSILSGSADSSIKVWDLKTGVCLKTLEGHTDWVICLLESKDGSILSGSRDSSIKIWKKCVLKKEII